MFSKFFASACGALLLSGCAATPPEQRPLNSELTHGNVQMTIRPGETTQAEILEVLGAPNITTIDGSGQEVWSYQRAAQAAQASSSGNYWTVILFSGGSSAAGFESSSRMMTLIIKFNDQKIVSDFRSRSSNF